jgi:hypothetical protein
VETDAAFAPVSALNALRRDALEKLASARREAFERSAQASAKATGDAARLPEPPPYDGPAIDAAHTLAVWFSHARMGQDFLGAGANLLVYTPRDWTAPALRAELPQLPAGTWLTLPAQMSDAAFASALPAVTANADRLAGSSRAVWGSWASPCRCPWRWGTACP